MAGFTLRQNDAPIMIEQWTKNSSSDTGVIGDIYYWNAGADAALPGAAATESFDRVGILTKPTINGDTTIEVQIPTSTQLWEADASAATSTGQNGYNMILTDQNTVNIGTSTASEALVVQVGVIGATGDKRILVRFSTIANGLSTF